MLNQFSETFSQKHNFSKVMINFLIWSIGMVLFNTEFLFYTEIQVESVWVVIQNTIIEENVIANKQQAPTSKDNSLSSHLSSLKYFKKIFYFIIWLHAYKLVIFIWWHGLYGFYFGQQNCRVLRALFLRFFFSCLDHVLWSFHKIVKKNYFLW